MEKLKSDGPRMSLHTLKVLRAMLENPNSDFYGLELVEQTRIKSGTLYPILMRLEGTGWLESDLENINPKIAGRRARRYYRLTRVGLERAKEELQGAQEALSFQPRLA
jgi:DNA-binding MarR family transcriptional regulator